MPARRPINFWIALVIVAALVGCAQDRPPERSEKSDPALAESDFISGEPCPAANQPSLPERSGCVSVVTEGNATLWVYASLDGDGLPLNWQARLVGPDLNTERDLGNRPDYPRAVAASDVDGDGDSEWWVQMGDYASHGAKWAYLNLFFLHDHELEPLRFEGEPLPINYGGISRMGEGAHCRDDTLVLLRAEAQDPQNTRWVVSERILELDGSEATLARRAEDVVTVDSYVDPRIRRYFRVECLGESLSPV